MFIQRFSSGTLAIAALGVTAFACSSDEPAASSSTTTSDQTATQPPAPVTTTTAAAATTTATPAPTIAPPQVEGSWGRAVLGSVSAYVVVRAGEAAIIDTGQRGSEGGIEQALAALDTGWSNVGTVLVTHRHPDHIGSLPAVMTAATDATAYAHPADIPQISAPRPVTPVADTESVFGLTVIHTPGHTPGHIALLEPALSVLFAGDAINGANPGVVGPNPQYTPDMGLAIESARRLGTFAYETVVFGHGEPVVGDADAAVAAMAAEL